MIRPQRITSVYILPTLNQLPQYLHTTYLLYLLHEDTCHGFKMNGCNATYADKYMCHVLKPYILLHFCVTASSTVRHQTEPKPFYITVGHLNVGSVGRLIPTMSCKMLGKGPT